jgi:hypothetical protein
MMQLEWPIPQIRPTTPGLIKPSHPKRRSCFYPFGDKKGFQKAVAKVVFKKNKPIIN